jgi:hypothetical protein
MYYAAEADVQITDFVFSPDVKYVAAISEDGCLRVIDALAEQSVYGHIFLTCLALIFHYLKACRLLCVLFWRSDVCGMVPGW